MSEGLAWRVCLALLQCLLALSSSRSAGWLRNACLVYGDVALMLLQDGMASEAHTLLDGIASLSSAEGW